MSLARWRLAAQPVGLIAYAGSQWLLFAYFLAKGGFVAGGDFALTQAIAAPIFALLSLSLRQLWVSKKGHSESYGRLVVLRLATTALATTLVPMIAILAGARIAPAPFAFVLFIKAQEAIADIFYAGLDGRDRSHIAGLLLAAKGSVITSVLITGWSFNLSIVTIGAAVAVGCGVILVIEGYLTAPQFDRRALALAEDWRGPAPLLSGIGWLSLSNLVIAVTGFVPRYALDIFATREILGQFATVMMPVTMLVLVATGVSQSSLLALTHSVIDRNPAHFIRLLGSRVALLTTMTLTAASIMLLIAVIPLPGIYGFTSTLPMTAGFVTLLMTPAMVAQIISYAYLPLRSFRTLTMINVAALGVSVVLAWPLLRLHPIYGGAALASLPSLVQILAFGRGLRRHFASQAATPA